VALVLDMVSAWSGRPAWYVGRVLVSPALPVAALLVWLVGWETVGASRRMVSAWREYLVGGSLTVLVAALASARSIGAWHDIEGVTITVVGEEIVYRLAAVLVVGALFARVCGRDWRNTSEWGTFPISVALVGAAVLFTMLPGHVEQMSGATNVAAFASLAILLGYVALRTGSLLPGIIVHLLLDLVTLTFFAGVLSASARAAVAATALTAFVLGLLVAGRRLGLRRRLPAVIDLRVAPAVATARARATAVSPSAPTRSAPRRHSS
jgi:hypothetical protein